MAPKNNIFDDLARVSTNLAAGLFESGKNISDSVRSKTQSFARSADLVTRDEFEVVKSMASRIRLENETLLKEFSELKKQLQVMASAIDVVKNQAIKNPDKENNKLLDEIKNFGAEINKKLAVFETSLGQHQKKFDELNVKTQAQKIETPKIEVAKKPDTAKAEPIKTESVKTESVKQDNIQNNVAAKPEMPKIEVLKPQQVKSVEAENIQNTDFDKIDAAISGISRSENVKTEPAKPETVKPAATKSEIKSVTGAAELFPLDTAKAEKPQSKPKKAANSNINLFDDGQN